ncbi:SET domain-containing protein 4-like [Liolophura sinensis]|uniref:SET domain-containing protein 4-like n=1 Tax=Liolophura sinensis TaxID=3198878 RepID=UPI00315806AD
MAESTCGNGTCRPACIQSAQRKGRTARTRRKQSASQKFHSLSHQSSYVNLFTWLKRKFDCRFKNLVVVDFPDTGRGLMTTVSLSPGNKIISLPIEALVTTETVLASTAGQFIKRYRPKLTAQEALCVFLMYERHLGKASEWMPYINLLPESFSTPGYFSESELLSLPQNAKEKTREHLKTLDKSYKNVRHFFYECWEEMQPFLSRSDFLWSWYAVNTRSVYLELPPSSHLQAQDQCMALAPVLDLLNHSPYTQVKAGLNKSKSHFEIITYGCYKPYEQVFIAYGAHDNVKLFSEYGFTVPRNPNNVFQFSKEHLKALLTTFDVSNLPEKSTCIREAQLKCLTANEDGLSWKLVTFLRIVSMTWDELQNWKVALQGNPVSMQNEELVKKMAMWLMKRAMDENQSTSKGDDCSLRIHQQLVKSLHEDELHILQVCQGLQMSGEEEDAG